MKTFEKNLQALRRWFAPAADAIAQILIPSGFEAVVGTDGTPTLRRDHAQPPRRVEWLGNTSMPAAAASSIVTSLEPGTTNGLGLGIGSGFEWLAFLAKLPRAQMLFVYEPDAAQLRMALEICDLSEAVASGRMVILPAGGDSEQVAEALATFLETHRGFEPPTVLHPLPTLGDRRNGLLAAGEAIVRKAVLRRHALIERLALQVGAHDRADGEREAAFLVHERYPGERPLHRQAQGTPTLYMDRHDETALARRLEVFAEVRPAVLRSDAFRSQLGPVVPANVVVETWVPPGVGAGYWERVPSGAVGGGGGGTLGVRDRVVVHGHHHAALLRERGIGESQIVMRTLEARFSGVGSQHGADRGGGGAIAMVADLPRISAEALNITLPTHLAVYAAARAIVEEEYLTVHEGCAEDVLRRAIGRAGREGTHLASDPALGEPMRRLIRLVLIPAVPMLRLASELERNGIPVKRLGEWPEGGAAAGGAEQSKASVVCWPDADGEVWKEVSGVVHLSPTGMVMPPVLQAAARGVPVLAVEHATDRLLGSIRDVLGDRVISLAAARLIPALKQVLREAGRD
ncbi:MAG TPA: hypothetical protein VHQ47_09045 [Phycisphaerae bacterium]|nr:hypothetical protein [Phycisphaerae bacterium]